jgi:hypothetical protein
MGNPVDKNLLKQLMVKGHLVLSHNIPSINKALKLNILQTDVIY